MLNDGVLIVYFKTLSITFRLLPSWHLLAQRKQQKHQSNV